MRSLGTVAALVYLAFLAGTFSVPARAGQRAVPCATVTVLASRGSGDTLGKDSGLSAPGKAFADRLAQLVPGAATPWANPYAAVGVFSLHLRKLAPELLNGVGAATQLSGLGVGAYHDSVVDGETKLATQIKQQLSGSCAATPIVLVGYSQGAQVTADVYQRDLTAAQQSHITAVVLFGDPYFNGSDRTVDRGSFSGRRDGLLGKRPNFTPRKMLVLSYCHSHDPICQGLFVRLGPTRTIDPGALTFQQHLNYTAFSEPQQAAELVAKLPDLQPRAASRPGQAPGTLAPLLFLRQSSSRPGELNLYRQSGTAAPQLLASHLRGAAASASGTIFPYPYLLPHPEPGRLRSLHPEARPHNPSME